MVAVDPTGSAEHASSNAVNTHLSPGEWIVVSPDILRLCGQTLDRLDVEWRFSKPTTISVAKREAVARLDAFVGPKY